MTGFPLRPCQLEALKVLQQPHEGPVLRTSGRTGWKLLWRLARASAAAQRGEKTLLVCADEDQAVDMRRRVADLGLSEKTVEVIVGAR